MTYAAILRDLPSRRVKRKFVALTVDLRLYLILKSLAIKEKRKFGDQINLMLENYIEEKLSKEPFCKHSPEEKEEFNLELENIEKKIPKNKAQEFKNFKAKFSEFLNS